MAPTDPTDDKQTQVDLWAGDETDTVLEPATFDEDEVTENTDATFAPLSLMEGSSHDPTRYLVEGVLGVGGMGEVERVVDRLLGRRIARKRIKSEWIGRSSIQSRFEDEARITAQLDHPGIISVHDMGMDAEGRPWFTMKEVRGKTFTRVIAEHRRTLRGELHSGEVGWTLHRTVQAFRQCCEAVGYAHHRKVLHRDIKPDNIMVGDFGEVWVLDWGLAKVVGQREGADPRQAPHITLSTPSSSGRTRHGSLTGTPAFMSPEQARGDHENLTPSSDTWALGAVLFTLLTGQPPWFGLDIYDVVARLRSDETPFWPPGVEKTAPEILVEICKRALHPDPLQRHANGGELATAIADWLEGAQRRERAMELVHQADQLQTGREGLQPEQAEARERERIRFLHAALTQDPRLPEAHSRLTDYYLGLHKASEAKGATQEARRWEDLIRVHDDGRNADYLDGEGRVTLMTEPEGARLTLCRLEYGPDGPEEIDLEDLGVSPLRDRRLPMGSHVIRIEADGYHAARYPVFVPRQGRWEGVRPGDLTSTPIPLLPLGTLKEDERYVPAGWFIGGSDHEILDAPVPRGWYWCDGMVVKQHPVTNAEYIEFLNDLVRQGRTQDALEYAPSDKPGTGAGRQVYHRSEDGRFHVGKDPQGVLWTPAMPVMQIPVHSAKAYTEYLSRRTGQSWRLPSELEWEKVARGVDGRKYPWGSEFQRGYCHHRGAIPDYLGPSDVGQFPIDASVYGASGMSGNVMEWCSSPYPKVSSVIGTVVEELSGEFRGRQATRGGSWIHERFFCRVDLRRSQPGAVVMSTVGFRVVRSILDKK